MIAFTLPDYNFVFKVIKDRIERGEMVDIAPYERKERFRLEVPLE